MSEYNENSIYNDAADEVEVESYSTDEFGFVVTTEEAPKRNITLGGTVQLQEIAKPIAQGVFSAATSDEAAKERIVASIETSYEMDRLVMTYGDFDGIDLSFLADLTDAEISSMLKSQQSKRSRLKGMDMTQNNYLNLLHATVCELLLRKFAGKPKGARVGTGARGTRSILTYTEEQLVALAENQDEVRREIRNLASKKSIYKNSDQFDETSELWANILQAEEQLKSIRQDAPRGGVKRTNKVAAAIVTAIEANEDSFEKMTKAQLIEFITVTLKDIAQPPEIIGDTAPVEIDESIAAEV
jgi:hypothetical protein